MSRLCSTNSCSTVNWQLIGFVNVGWGWLTFCDPWNFLFIYKSLKWWRHKRTFLPHKRHVPFPWEHLSGFTNELIRSPQRQTDSLSRRLCGFQTEVELWFKFCSFMLSYSRDSLKISFYGRTSYPQVKRCKYSRPRGWKQHTNIFIKHVCFL